MVVAGTPTRVLRAVLGHHVLQRGGHHGTGQRLLLQLLRAALAPLYGPLHISQLILSAG